MTCKIVILGDRAVMRLTEGTPEFWFYFATQSEAFSPSGPSSTDDFVLARLEKRARSDSYLLGREA
jgi:hypothetical protein